MRGCLKKWGTAESLARTRIIQTEIKPDDQVRQKTTQARFISSIGKGCRSKRAGLLAALCSR